MQSNLEDDMQKEEILSFEAARPGSEFYKFLDHLDRIILGLEPRELPNFKPENGAKNES